MKTDLYMITEHSPFMMSFVYLTAAGRAVVIDGGRPEDIPELLSLIGTRPIAAWLMTHPHMDHISGLIDAVSHTPILEKIEGIYGNFPSSEFVLRCEPDEIPTILDFERILPLLGDKYHRAQPGTQLSVDELTMDFLFCGGERYEQPRPNLAVNESSLAFKVTAPGLRSVLFLGDLGPAAGRDLLAWCCDKLPSDVVQMAHHGHSGVLKDVYEKISPTACLWCAPDWLWEEEDIEFEPEVWGTRHIRKWMEDLGITEHYITKDGTQRIPL